MDKVATKGVEEKHNNLTTYDMQPTVKPQIENSVKIQA
jgi:hypothetical protein